jgi:chitin synthase
LEIIDKYELGPVTYKWTDIVGSLTVYQTYVLDMTEFMNDKNKNIYPPDIVKTVEEHLGNDLSFPLAGNSTLRNWGECLTSIYKVGQLEDRSVGCFISDVILWVSLIVILSVVLIRFIFAMLFSWFISRKLGKLQKNMKQRQPMRRSVLADGIVPFPMFHQGTYNSGRKISFTTAEEAQRPQPTPIKLAARDRNRYSLDFMRFGSKNAVQKSQSEYGKEVRTIMLVTCYSEDEDALRKTFDSLAETKYNEDFKLLFIVADGIITGSGNSKSTPELIIDMLEMDSSWPYPPPALSYFSLADGSREHNKARVYAAWYNSKVIIGNS